MDHCRRRMDLDSFFIAAYESRGGSGGGKDKVGTRCGLSSGREERSSKRGRTREGWVGERLRVIYSCVGDRSHLGRLNSWRFVSSSPVKSYHILSLMRERTGWRNSRGTVQ